MRRRIAASMSRSLCSAALVACAVYACRDDSATGSSNALLEGADVVIAAIDPDTATVDTTVTVRITGSGFAEGATATWLVDTTEVAEIRTISTTWKSPSEIEARIAISPDAPLRAYSVRIRGKKGKQGIAVERFRVVAKPTALPEPGHSSEALDINDSGVIVGNAHDASGTLVAVRWTLVDTTWTYRILGSGSAVAINNEGLIVRVDFDPLARSWSSWIQLPSGTLAGFTSAYVRDVSDNGTLIGLTGTPTPRTAVVWRRLSAASWGEPEALPLLDGFNGADVVDINAHGDIVGLVYQSAAIDGVISSTAVVWLYRDGRWQPPIRVDTTLRSGVDAINDNGALVGWFLPCIVGLPNCYANATWWPSVGGPRIDLPTLYASQARVTGINNANQIVGSALVHHSDGVVVHAPLVRHAVIWFPGSLWPEDLGAIRPSHAGTANAINNHGWVAGSMNNYTLARHATVWKLPAAPTVSAPPAARR